MGLQATYSWEGHHLVCMNKINSMRRFIWATPMAPPQGDVFIEADADQSATAKHEKTSAKDMWVSTN